MLHYGVVFLVVALLAALLAAILGFSGIAGGPAATAKTMSIVFIALALLSLLFGWLRGR